MFSRSKKELVLVLSVDLVVSLLIAVFLIPFVGAATFLMILAAYIAYAGQEGWND